MLPFRLKLEVSCTDDLVSTCPYWLGLGYFENGNNLLLTEMQLIPDK